MIAQPEIRGVTIAGTGHYVPERRLTNHDLEGMVDTSDEWIVARTGIRERRIAAPDQASSDLALIACQRALEMAQLEPGQVDQIVLATTTPDRFLPSCACTLQNKLGARGAAAFDMFAACSGFVFGLGIGRGLIGAGVADTVLVVGVETLSRVTDYTDRNTCVLFGDGAGAAVLTAARPGVGLHSIRYHSDGELGDVLEIPAGGSREPADADSVRLRRHTIGMRGRKLFPFAVRSMEDSLREVLGDAGWKPEDLDLLIPHQANLRIIEAVRERLAIPSERVVVNIDRFGNTSSASIAIALDEVVRSGQVKPGDKLGFTAFGGGATWGSATMTWSAARIDPDVSSDGASDSRLGSTLASRGVAP